MPVSVKGRCDLKDTIDPSRLLPAYSVAEAAHYLRLPVATLRSWILGRPYPVAGGGMRRAPPALQIAAEPECLRKWNEFFKN